ncbi:MAG: BamA/TamA family outer membrane protein, partial [Longimicrobiales bacterium]
MHRLDEREFLAVRLIDFMVNDSDRTADNFHWARYDSDDDNYLWRPLPRDRDRAFMDAQGWLNRFVTRRFYPKLVEWTPEYSLEGLTYSSHPLDRRLLQRLTRQDFEQVALRVQQAIDAEVIEAVIAELPPRWRAQTTAAGRLRHVLTARAATLPEIALEFYRDLAGEVDIHGTNEDEYADVVRHDDGQVTVTVVGMEDAEAVEVVRHDDGSVTLAMNGAADSAAAGTAPYYRRTFLPSETNEVRLYLGDGDDLAIVRGAPRDAIIVRVIGGKGDDVLVDSAGGGGTYMYDSDGDDRFISESGKMSRQAWTAPAVAGGFRLGKAWRPDWGGSSGWGPVIGYGEGSGPIIGVGPTRTQYGFRRLPHHWTASAKLLVGLGSGRLGVTADAEYRGENAPLAFTVVASASQLDAFRFYGYGNDSPEASRDRTLVTQNTITFAPTLVWHIGWRSREGLSDPLRGVEHAVAGLRPVVGRLDAGPVLYWSDPEPGTDSPLASTDALGRDAVGRVGFRLGLELDHTDRDVVPTRGWTFDAQLAGYPPVWDAAEAFSTATADGSAYLPLFGDGPHLAVRAGGALASGSFPVQHAPFAGGRNTLRGHAWRRYTGD